MWVWRKGSARALETHSQPTRGCIPSEGGRCVQISGGTTPCPYRSYMKGESNQNLSGNEIYYTNSLISLVKNLLCGQLHCQKGSHLIPLSCKIVYRNQEGGGARNLLAYARIGP